ncbi:hypothetical protein QR680_008830 [Steinernema hermaphroditum]|uniref:Tartrate-resistant acid phosphatase type 5 n=1 Tax=Steinernema hermaphroditum TaxID=289476 RepID=A0AA39IJH7_9BILA|nr:hypothetical protein QR680_008830 [Steinernema hermaphroditum]
MISRPVVFFTATLLATAVPYSSIHNLQIRATTPFRRLSCTGKGVCERPESRSLRFFLVGDTGGIPIYPYTTYGQKKVARMMNDLAAVNPVDFVVNLGDNVYFNGVSDIFDSRFEKSFEDVYDAEHLQVPWYMIAGNHDHFGNITAQIHYTNYSSKWTFPDLYYKTSYRFGPRNVSVDFVFIDTIVLCGNTQDIQNGGFLDVILTKQVDPEEPSDPEAAHKQWEWIVEQLNSSTSDYLFVAGHYPIFSISSHGPSKCLIEHLSPLLKQFGASAYFAGHDHTVQHIRELDGDDEVVLSHFVSGGASRTDRSSAHKKSVPEAWLQFHYPSGFNPFSQLGFTSGAFISVDVDEYRAKFNFYKGSGSELYETTVLPRKRKSSDL